MPLVANIVSLTFTGTLITCVFMYAYNGDIWWIWLFGGLIVANVIVSGLKPLFGIIPPFGRPAGATGCDAFCLKGPVGGEPGFPSGHMTISSMFVAALWLRYHNPLILWIGVPWLIAMGWSRWAKRCHNIEQIMAGTLTGVLSAVILLQITKYFKVNNRN
jgi:membrane-associated phospholipid phosphatase